MSSQKLKSQKGARRADATAQPLILYALERILVLVTRGIHKQRPMAWAVPLIIHRCITGLCYESSVDPRMAIRLYSDPIIYCKCGNTST